jgi:hypothetical protein
MHASPTAPAGSRNRREGAAHSTDAREGTASSRSEPTTPLALSDDASPGDPPVVRFDGTVLEQSSSSDPFPPVPEQGSKVVSMQAFGTGGTGWVRFLASCRAVLH